MFEVGDRRTGLGGPVPRPTREARARGRP